ncbi:Uu.00g057690.m01.CDS01 [Anthostomella pinea]|uniref:Uu.00g057690.m01.CDS01 n=1 Tax=Anthostomella pinea TaxID=933095 RepID=A0AAI8VSI9_9PEZI|nr:Uu.00g057690.m01.CDS01 [Anthostomella pinea]
MTGTAESYCANFIANLEGWKGIELPKDDGLLATLEALDRRMRALEAMDRITPPPPMLEPSWDSLTWRVCRLANRWPGRPINTVTPPFIQPSLPLLKSAIAGIVGPKPMSWPEKEDLEEKEVISRATQWLCHTAGGRVIKACTSFNLAGACALALDLSLEVEARPGMPLVRRPPGPVGPPIRPPIIKGPKKSCCGCCVCSCHGKEQKKTDSKRVSAWLTGNSKSKKSHGSCGSSRVAGWFKKLAFWRRTSRCYDTDSDSGSEISSLSSATMIV